MVKVLFIIVDGIGDCGSKENGWKTVFQTVPTPHLDRLAETGVNGLMDSYEAGFSCGSDTSHLNIFGYTPRVYYKGRGAFETEGSGLIMQPGDIAFKSNMAYMNPETKIVEKRRVDREFQDWGLELIKYLDGMVIPGFEEYKVSTKHATEHRIGLLVSGPGLSNDITDSDPLVDDLELLKIKPLKPEAELTARVVRSSYSVQCTV
jgi:2,3-diphosphopglycerate-independent phosphoglycerate mutase